MKRGRPMGVIKVSKSPMVIPWDRTPAIANILELSLDAAASFSSHQVFSSFVASSGNGLKKSEVLKTSNILATSLQVLASDPGLQDVIKRYQNVSDEIKKLFIRTAIELLK